MKPGQKTYGVSLACVTWPCVRRLRRMESSDLALLIAFGLAWWLGLYLLGRDLHNPQLRFAGLGLVAYALALAALLLAEVAPEPQATETLLRLGWPLVWVLLALITGIALASRVRRPWLTVFQPDGRVPAVIERVEVGFAPELDDAPRLPDRRKVVRLAAGGSPCWRSWGDPTWANPRSSTVC